MTKGDNTENSLHYSSRTQEHGLNSLVTNATMSSKQGKKEPVCRSDRASLKSRVVCNKTKWGNGGRGTVSYVSVFFSERRPLIAHLLREWQVRMCYLHTKMPSM